MVDDTELKQLTAQQLDQNFIGDSPFNVKRKPPEQSPALRYFHELRAEYGADYAKLAKVGNVVVAWNGHQYQTTKDDDWIKDALNFLEVNAPNRWDDKNAQTCFKTMRCKLRELPPARSGVLPLKNTCLQLADDGRMLVLPHDLNNNNQWIINCDLPGPFTPYASYELPELRQDSLFAHYLRTSLAEPEVHAVLQEFLGTTLTTINHQTALILTGAGGNGKSVYQILARALHEKTASLNIAQLNAQTMLPLVDASLVLVPEVPHGELPTHTIKQLIAGDECQVKRLYEDFFTIRPFAKWILATNNPVFFKETNHAIERRFISVPFGNTISAGERINDIDQKIIATELDQVLIWALHGLKRWLANGMQFTTGAVLAQARDDAKTSTNIVSRFLKFNPYELTAKANPNVTKAGLIKVIADWCDENNERAPSGVFVEQMITQAIPGAKLIKAGSDGARVWAWNITPTPEPDLTPEPPPF